ncbi:MAG: thermonuclease family protein [Pseudomonadota bacterium]|nr:thermonuclease family protein [Pseudomonadota bacterium]
MRQYFNLITLCVLVAFPALSAAAQVAEVVDGDTIRVGEVTYRIEGIDAPEHGQKCGTWSCGNDATTAMSKLVQGKRVECVGESLDDYGRVLARCHVDGADFGATLISAGLAWAFTKYSDTYVDEENEARQRGVGIWSGSFQTPWGYRAERWEVEAQVAPDGCPIKGNISSNGKIYHPPWSPWYSRTKISVEKGERWFCSEAEAVRAGWRAPLWR